MIIYGIDVDLIRKLPRNLEIRSHDRRNGNSCTLVEVVGFS